MFKRLVLIFAASFLFAFYFDTIYAEYRAVRAFRHWQEHVVKPFRERTGHVYWDYFVMFDEFEEDGTMRMFCVMPGDYPPYDFFKHWCETHPVLGESKEELL